MVDTNTVNVKAILDADGEPILVDKDVTGHLEIVERNGKLKFRKEITKWMA